MKPLRSPAAAPALVAAVVLLALLAWLLVPTGVVIGWMDEGAPIEAATVGAYVLVAAAVVLAAARRAVPSGIAAALAVTLLAFAAREADWHIHLTGTSMLRVSYYLGPAPLAHKLAGLAAVAALLASWAYLAAAAWRAWRGRRLPGRAVRTSVATFLATLVGAKLLDRAFSVLTEDFGWQLGPTARALQVAIEEPLELALPVIVLLAIWQHAQAARAAALQPAA